MYQDREVSVTVIPDRQLVFIQGGFEEKVAVARAAAMESVLDSILANSTVLESGAVDVGGAVERHIVLKPHPEIQSRLGVERLTVVADVEVTTLKQVVVDHRPGQSVTRTAVTYHSIDLEYEGPEFDTSVANLVLGEDGGLLPRYQDYRLVDTRR